MLHALDPSHDSPMNRFDPRVRVVVAVGLGVCIALVDQLDVLTAALAGCVAVMLVARLPLRFAVRRLAPLNGFVLVLFVLLPITATGQPWLELGPVTVDRGGSEDAARIALKANAIVVLVPALLATMSVVTFGHALEHLRVPPRFALLLMLAVRYTDVIGQEAQRLRRAMKARGFRAGMNRHTYRSLGYLVGMLLARSFDRGHRVLAAMKCRGFVHTHPPGHRGHAGIDRLGWHDWTLAAAAVAIGVALVGASWR